MNTVPASENKGQSRTVEDDPQYFGLYLNLARENLIEVESHVRIKFGKKKLNEESLKQSLLCDHLLSVDRWTKVYGHSRRYLPFLHYFDPDSQIEKDHDSKTGVDPDSAQRLIRELYSLLDFLRNDFSHNRLDGTTFEHLEVSPDISSFITGTYSLACGRAQSRFADFFKPDDFVLAKNRKEQLISVADGKECLTVSGFAFFICLFLDREQASGMLSRIRGFKRTDENWARAVHETFCDLCIRHPHDRLESSNTKEALLLDMLNELNRCPRILYDMLPEEERAQFLPALDENSMNNLSENSLNEESRLLWDGSSDWAEALTKRIRHQDRFPYLMLRFIEEMDLLKGIRFRVDLGEIELDSYSKKVGRNGEYDRTITDHALAFGKLSDFQNEEEVSRMISGEASYPVRFSLFAPRYAIYDNKIGYCHTSDPVYPKSKTGEKRALSNPRSMGFISVHDLRKLLLMELLCEGSFSRMQSDFLRKANRILDETAEGKLQFSALFPEMRHRFIPPQNPKSKDRREKAETTLEKYKQEIKGRKDKLNSQLLSAFDMNQRQLPSRLLDEWMNIRPASHSVKLRTYVKQLNEDCRLRLRKFRKDGDGKARAIPLVGEMATFLSQDIVRMIISEETKKLITSAYYNEMQRSLAQYAGEENRCQFRAIVAELRLLDPSSGHPFLFATMETAHRYTEDFYKCYLEKKREWLAKTFYRPEQDENTKRRISVFFVPDGEARKLLPLLIRRRMKEQNDLQDWIRNKQAHPIDLPSHLFDSKVMELLKVKDGKKKWNEAFKDWWSTKYPDGMQPFYGLRRELNIHGKSVSYIPSDGKKFADCYTHLMEKTVRDKKRELRTAGKPVPPDLAADIKRSFHRAVNEREFMLRLVQEDDRLMLMAINKMMTDREEDILPGLKNIDSILDEENQFSLAVHAKVLEKEGEGGDNSLSLVPATIEIKSKRKDWSKYIRYRYDRRVPGLMSHFPEHKATLDEVKTLLGEYDRCRIKIFDWAFALEGAIMSDLDLKPYLHESSSREGKSGEHSTLVKMLVEKKGCLTPDESQYLILIRNKAAHNQFPCAAEMPLIYRDVSAKVGSIEGSSAKDLPEGSSLVDSLWKKYEMIIRKILPILDHENRFFGKLLNNMSQPINDL